MYKQLSLFETPQPRRFKCNLSLAIAYLVDATKRKLVRQFCDKNVQDVVYDGQKNLLITADWTHLNWIDADGKILTSKSIATEGVRDLKVEGRVLSGIAIVDYEGGGKRFWFDLDNLKILRWEKILAIKSNGKKSWWKFW